MHVNKLENNSKVVTLLDWAASRLDAIRRVTRRLVYGRDAGSKSNVMIK